jgi:hypothetical protein
MFIPFIAMVKHGLCAPNFMHDYVHSYLGLGTAVVWSGVDLYEFLVRVI